MRIGRRMAQCLQQCLPLLWLPAAFLQPLLPLQQWRGMQVPLGKPTLNVRLRPLPRLRLRLQHGSDTAPALQWVAAETMEIRSVHLEGSLIRQTLTATSSSR